MSTNWSYFRMLGHKDGKYYYQQNVTKQILELTRKQHTHNALICLAPIEYWQTMFPSRKGIDWLAAFSAMMHECAGRGEYNPDAPEPADIVE